MQCNRRNWIFSASGALLALTEASPIAAAPKPGKYLVYVGTYTRGDSKGIYAYRFDAASGALEPLGLAGEIVNPSFVALHPNGRFLYSVSELGNDGDKTGSVSAFAIDTATGTLKKLNTAPTGGGGSCHLVVDKTGKSIMVANYGSGSTTILPVLPDGRLGETPVVIQHSGTGANPARQKGPHAHAVVLSPDNRFVFVPDLGLDKVFIYRLDPAKPSLTPNDPPFGKVPAGAGPRHFTFAPNGKYAYTVNEMGSSVTAFQYDASRGALTEVQTISTLPKDFKGENNSAEIQVDAKGKFLYASNRGHNSIAVFAIAKDGKLTPVEHVLTQGKAPRNFRIDPTGAYLFAANQDTGNIVIFRVDAKSGKLTPTGKTVNVPFPVCVEFLAV